MVNFYWTELSVDDLRLIHEYISKDSNKYAERLVEKIIERVDQLQNFPKSGRVVPEFDRPEIRELIEGTYRIIYHVTITRVSILRVHHSARLLK